MRVCGAGVAGEKQTVKKRMTVKGKQM